MLALGKSWIYYVYAVPRPEVHQQTGAVFSSDNLATETALGRNRQWGQDSGPDQRLAIPQFPEQFDRRRPVPGVMVVGV